MQASVLHGLKQGNEVLKELHKEMNTESVERLLEETAEARAYQRVCPKPFIGFWLRGASQEIDEMLSNTLSLDEEEAVQAELQKLQDEDQVRSVALQTSTAKQVYRQRRSRPSDYHTFRRKNRRHKILWRSSQPCRTHPPELL